MPTTKRLTVDLSPRDDTLLEELVEKIGATTKAEATRSAIRRLHAITKLGEDPSPDAVKLALSF